MSRWLPPGGSAQKATRSPWGETFGWMASKVPESLRVLPLASSTAQISLVPVRP